MPTSDARRLLESIVDGHIDDPVATRIVEETGGNPLALVELGSELSGVELNDAR